MDQRVLLLNASFEPLCTVGLRRAVVLVLSDKAEVVSEGTGVVRSQFLELKAPSVVRLVRYVNVPRQRIAHLGRRAVLRRDRHECCYCGGRASTVDHVVPRSRGGDHCWTNVVACCLACNSAKGDRTPDEMGWRMRFSPFEPDAVKWSVSAHGRIDPAWRAWVAA